jgi:hypothetical protein
MAWLNGGMFPDLHRPTGFQRHLSELVGDGAEDRLTETVYRAAFLGVFGRPVSDHTIGEMGSISAGPGEHGWLPRSLAIGLNAASMPPSGHTLSKAIRVHRLSSGAPPIQSVEPTCFLVFGRRPHPPASMCWTTGRRSDAFLRSRRSSWLDLCSSSTFRQLARSDWLRAIERSLLTPRSCSAPLVWPAARCGRQKITSCDCRLDDIGVQSPTVRMI